MQPNPYAAPQMQMPPQYPMAAMQQCQACHRNAPTKDVMLLQNIGAIILRFPRTVRGLLCKRCISKYFWEMTTITFFLGWWGVISFFYTLYSIPHNIVVFLASRDLPDA
jgi:hypothetical protein